MTIKLNFTSNYDIEKLQELQAFLHDKNNEIGLKVTVKKIIIFLAINRTILFLSGTHLFTLIHEFGHALTFKMMTGKGSIIEMSPLHCFGSTQFATLPYKLTQLQEIWISLSRHLTIVLFSAIIILGIFALTHYVAMPLGAVIALRIIVAVPVIINTLQEGAYAISCAYENANDGDFGDIRHRGGLPAVFLCAALLIIIIALCIIGIVFLF